MTSMFTRKDRVGNVYLFSPDRHTLAEFSDFADATAVSDDFRTVTTWELDRKEGVSFGRGNSENPDRAEAYFYFDAQNTTPAAIAGSYRLVILNAANEVVAVVDRGRLEEVRKGDPSTDTRGDWGKPMKYRSIRGGVGEVLGGQGHKVALQIETDSGTETFSTSDSELVAEGYGGRLQT